MDDALSDWLSRYWFVTRPAEKMQAGFICGSRFFNSSGHWTIKGRSATEHLPGLARLALDLAERLGGDYGLVHPLTDSEVAEALPAARPDIAVTNSRTGAVTISTGHFVGLREGLPTLYWANILGPRYRTLFGDRRLREASWARTSMHGDAFVGFVTNDPPTDATWLAFRDRRDTIIRDLGPAAFWPDGTQIPDLSI